MVLWMPTLEAIEKGINDLAHAPIAEHEPIAKYALQRLNELAAEGKTNRDKIARLQQICRQRLGEVARWRKLKERRSPPEESA
jgi:hypothetical protein